MPDKWDHMTDWHLVLPPSRPSSWYLNHILASTGGISRSAPVGVLGSTPEFRDLLRECGFTTIYVLDRSITFHRAVSRERVYSNEEHLLVGDWRETLPNLKNTFALILSDLTSGNIPYDYRSEFYKLLAGALSPGGILIDKVLTHPGSHIEIESIVRKYSRLPLNLQQINYFSC